MAGFTPGIEPCRRFYVAAVRPILAAAFPNLVHSAALLGNGSEVLGYDSVRSTDHHEGPRLLLFLTPGDCECLGARIVETLARRLPLMFMGYSIHFGPPDAAGVRLLRPVALPGGSVDTMSRAERPKRGVRSH